MSVRKLLINNSRSVCNPCKIHDFCVDPCPVFLKGGSVSNVRSTLLSGFVLCVVLGRVCRHHFSFITTTILLFVSSYCPYLSLLFFLKYFGRLLLYKLVSGLTSCTLGTPLGPPFVTFVSFPVHVFGRSSSVEPNKILGLSSGHTKSVCLTSPYDLFSCPPVVSGLLSRKVRCHLNLEFI